MNNFDAERLGPKNHSKVTEDSVIAAAPENSGRLEMGQHALLPTQDAGQLVPRDRVDGTVAECPEFHDIPLPQSVETAGKLEPIVPSKHGDQADAHRGLIDTAAPFESVKEVVTKFGGIINWKAKTQTAERRNNIEHELENEIPKYKKQYEAAKDSKEQVIRNLDSTKRLIEELKLNLERAQIEEQQAKQETEFARLRVEEMEHGTADEVSIAAKAQLEVTKARHAAVLIELKSVKDELEKLRVEYASLVAEKDVAAKRAEETACATKEVDKTVEELTRELITTKESLLSAHVAHLKAEEKTIVAAIDRDQDSLIWEKELKQAEVDLERLNQQLLSEKDLKFKLDSASVLLLELKAELAAYMEAKLVQENGEEVISEDAQEEPKMKNDSDLQAVVASGNKEFEKVRVNIEKATAEANCLKMAAVSLKSQLQREKSALATMRQREGMATVVVASLEADLNKITSEIGIVQMEEKEARENMVVLPKKLQEVSKEADGAKSLAQLAREELQKARKEAEEGRAGANTMNSRLYAVQKEIEASRESERLALEAVKALQESELAATTSDDDATSRVTLSIEEYYALSKQAYEAEERARIKVTAAVSQIEVAKESELRSLEKLDEAIREITAKKEELRIAMEKADKAEEGKLGVEQELRDWRAEHEQQRRTSNVDGVVNSTRVSPRMSSEPKSTDKDATVPILPAPNTDNMAGNDTESDSSPEVKVAKKKKSKLFPRIVMFFAKKNVKASKSP
ncbi:WEB family [Macleaya cordata]|uniref:WEB family n=1 Tax=Macleaya cordata TaxID=56857 RepID=A0A200QJ50_MACCD|nr:WEB family [Macleaya cordata]